MNTQQAVGGAKHKSRRGCSRTSSQTLAENVCRAIHLDADTDVVKYDYILEVVVVPIHLDPDCTRGGVRAKRRVAPVASREPSLTDHYLRKERKRGEKRGRL